MISVLGWGGGGGGLFISYTGNMVLKCNYFFSISSYQRCADIQFVVGKLKSMLTTFKAMTPVQVYGNQRSAQHN